MQTCAHVRPVLRTHSSTPLTGEGHYAGSPEHGASSHSPSVTDLALNGLTTAFHLDPFRTFRAQHGTFVAEAGVWGLENKELVGSPWCDTQSSTVKSVMGPTLEKDGDVLVCFPGRADPH